MSNIKDITILRQKSGLGLMECKRALEDARGSIELAADNLRKLGLSKMDGLLDREAKEGIIVASFSDRKCALIEVNTETDFSTNSVIAGITSIANEILGQEPGEIRVTNSIQAMIDDLRIRTRENVTWRRGFILEADNTEAYIHHDGKLGTAVSVNGDINKDDLYKICMHIASVVPTPLGITGNDVPEHVINKEREIALEQALAAGKPEAIAEKMVEGKMRKFMQGVVLIRQPLVMDTSLTVSDLLPEGSLVQKFIKYRVGE